MRSASDIADRSRRSRPLGVGFALVLLVWALPVAAQEALVQVDRGPYYVGEPFEVRVVAKDFAEDPQPEVTIGQHADGSLRLIGASPSSSTSITIINGKFNRVKEVSVAYRYEFTANREGRIRIPEFAVSQGGTSRQTKSFEVDVVGVPKSEAVGITVELPKGPIFVGQRVPVTVEFRIDRAAQQSLVSYEVRVPLFDLPTVRFVDEAPPQTDTQLEIDTEAGTLRLPATSTEEQIGGRKMLVVRAQRTMIPLVAEELRAEAPTAFVSQGTRFRRDLFNQRQATSVERSMAKGRAVQLDVVEVPRRGRPPSFAGAVGSGYSLEVDADRSVVQVGEPIELTFHLRGNGDLSSAGLPPLDVQGLFDPHHFRVPKEPPAGIVDKDGKHFELTVRVLDADVREIPALSYTWFDADSLRFETTHSQPIALSVGAAQIIGADAVTARADESGSAAAAAPEESGPPTAEAGERSASMALTGANLAVDRDLATLLRDERGSGQARPATLVFYGAGLACLLFAFFDQRRRAIDPRTLQRREAFRRAEKNVRVALAGSGSDAAAALGRTLRELVAALPEEADAEFDALIAECDALRFAPGPAASAGGGNSAGGGRSAGGRRSAGGGNSGGGVPAALAERARRFVSDRAGVSAKTAGDS